MDIVLRLRELRRAARLSQKELAAKSGIGEKTLSSFETGTRIGSLKLAQLEAIAHVYDLDLATFFSPGLAASLAGEAPVVLDRIRASIASLPPEAQDAIATMVAQIAATVPAPPAHRAPRLPLPSGERRIHAAHRGAAARAARRVSL